LQKGCGAIKIYQDVAYPGWNIRNPPNLPVSGG
jgi:hypothetical protein